MMLSAVRPKQSEHGAYPGGDVPVLAAVGAVYLLELAGAGALSLFLFHQTLDAVLSLPLALGMGLWLVVCMSRDLAWGRVMAGAPYGASAVTTSTLQWVGVLLLVLTITGTGTIPLAVFGATMLLTIPCRLTARGMQRQFRRGLGRRELTRVVIVGAGRVGQLVAASLIKYEGDHTMVLGFVDGPEAVDGARQVLGLPVYDVAQLDPLLRKGNVTDVVFAFSRLPDSALLTLMRRCAGWSGVRVTVIPRFYEAVQAHAYPTDIHGLPLVHLAGPQGRIDGLVRPLLDRAFAALGLLACAPILLLAACAVRLEGSGPIFFRQRRVGLHNTLFTMYKLRSMREPRPGEGIDAPSRYTRVGAFLRKTSIDELPQLWNVIRGEMSLVGPRPERPEYVALFAANIPDYNRRHQVRGGITGLAQVKGLRGATSIVERSRLDNFYVDHRSLWLDVKIILLTFSALIPTSQGIGGEEMFQDLVTEVARFRAAPGDGAAAPATVRRAPAANGHVGDGHGVRGLEKIADKTVDGMDESAAKAVGTM